MVDNIPESSNWKRYLEHCKEMKDIEMELNGQEVPEEKRRTLSLRLKHIREKIIPEFVTSFSGGEKPQA